MFPLKIITKSIWNFHISLCIKYSKVFYLIYYLWKNSFYEKWIFFFFKTQIFTIQAVCMCVKYTLKMIWKLSVANNSCPSTHLFFFRKSLLFILRKTHENSKMSKWKMKLKWLNSFFYLFILLYRRIALRLTDKMREI